MSFLTFLWKSHECAQQFHEFMDVSRTFLVDWHHMKAISTFCNRLISFATSTFVSLFIGSRIVLLPTFRFVSSCLLVSWFQFCILYCERFWCGGSWVPLFGPKLVPADYVLSDFWGISIFHYASCHVLSWYGGVTKCRIFRFLKQHIVAFFSRVVLAQFAWFCIRAGHLDIWVTV